MVLDDPQATDWFAFSLVTPEDTYVFCTLTELDRDNVLFFVALFLSGHDFIDVDAQWLDVLKRRCRKPGGTATVVSPPSRYTRLCPHPILHVVIICVYNYQDPERPSDENIVTIFARILEEVAVPSAKRPVSGLPYKLLQHTM